MHHSGELCSLEQRTGLTAVNYIHFTVIERKGYYAKDGAVSSGVWAAGVAVGENTGTGGYRRCVEVTQGLFIAASSRTGNLVW